MNNSATLGACVPLRTAEKVRMPLSGSTGAAMGFRLASPMGSAVCRASMADEELAVAYAGGDAAAFDLLLERTGTRLLAYILFVVRNSDVAQDVFQDTYLKAIVKLQSGEYRPKGRFTAWLTRIAHNAIMDRFRTEQNTPVVDLADGNDLSRISCPAGADEPVETSIVNEQTLSQVRLLMDALPAAQREVVFMRYFQQMTFREIARLTGVSINTSLGRMHYAVLNMRRMVKRKGLELKLT